MSLLGSILCIKSICIPNWKWRPFKSNILLRSSVRRIVSVPITLKSTNALCILLEGSEKIIPPLWTLIGILASILENVPFYESNVPEETKLVLI